MRIESPTEGQIRLLADKDNRAILSILDDADRPLHVEDLAERLVSRAVTMVGSSEYEEQLERALISLHHDRLPRLADVGLVEYDREANRATFRGLPAADVEWLDETTLDELLAPLGTGEESGRGQLGVLTGRESILRYGRQLADEAEEELFCMYVSPDLLENECVRRAESAIDRGVEMYLGSQNPEVRALTREHLPEATIWEPQLDLTNSPTYPRVGRLVLIDRRKAMLAILDEPEDDGTYPEERAVVGEGENNPLVVLIRELLGSRLDHLDYQSGDLRSKLPS